MLNLFVTTSVELSKSVFYWICAKFATKFKSKFIVHQYSPFKCDRPLIFFLPRGRASYPCESNNVNRNRYNRTLTKNDLILNKALTHFRMSNTNHWNFCLIWLASTLIIIFLWNLSSKTVINYFFLEMLFKFMNGKKAIFSTKCK